MQIQEKPSPSTYSNTSPSPTEKTQTPSQKTISQKQWIIGIALGCAAVLTRYLTKSQQTQVLKGHTKRVNSVSFSPNSTTLASGSYDNTIRLWDVKSGKELRVLKGHRDEVNSVSFSPDRKTLASCSNDHTIRLWDVTSREELKVLKRHTDWVQSVSFSPDGKTLASGSDDNTVRLWDVRKSAWQQIEKICSYLFR